MKDKAILAALWISVGLLGRLVIHIPDVTPLTSLSVLAGFTFSKRFSLLLIVATLILSDVALAIIFGMPAFGAWTWFTYSGFAAMVFLARSKLTWCRGLLCALIASMGFWLWTNFGVWLMSAMYAHTFSGLWQCYVMALPFLRNSLLGDFMWMFVLLAGIRFCFSNNNVQRYIPVRWSHFG